MIDELIHNPHFQTAMQAAIAEYVRNNPPQTGPAGSRGQPGSWGDPGQDAVRRDGAPRWNSSEVGSSIRCTMESIPERKPISVGNQGCGNLRLHRAGDAIYHIPYTSSAKRYTYLNRMVSKCVHILADSSTNMMFLL